MATITVKPNYFTCTLGHAAQSKEQDGHLDHEFGTVMQLIDGNCRRFPQAPALGFADYASTPHKAHDTDFLTFGELSILSYHAADRLRTLLGLASSRNIPIGSNIGLLSTSSIDFVLTWLGLLRLGYTAVFLAPQLQPQAIEHLCATLNVQVLLVEDSSSIAIEGVEQVEIPRLPPYQEFLPNGQPLLKIESNREPEIAYFSHTSGTSSGLPKPVPQPQSGIVQVLPCFQEENQPATFSMTPLYHGGLPDLLRSWTSRSMIWFFPEGLAPITASNIINAVAHARKKCDIPVQYFTSVPYILQMLSEDKHGLELLRSMDLVGVGGAPLPPSIGDGLVGAGINLVSRMGSMESGFLMSSHRDYQKDREWQYLRPIQDERYLRFEPRENRLSELVVKPAWPLRVKTNRDDGSYATADLFEPHGTIPNAWRYHSRADSQLMLANGKKFDPAPMEADILAATNILRDVFIFGSGQNYPGLLLFPSSLDTSDTTIFETVWPVIQKINSRSQGHTRISRSMIIVVSVPLNEAALQKSSKGTIIRNQAEERYKSWIEAAYSKPGLAAPVQIATRDQLFRAVLECFFRVLGRKIDPDEDLYKQNVDSMACLQIRAQVVEACLSDPEGQLPLNIIYECGSVNNLVKHLEQVRSGEFPEKQDQIERRHQLMRHMADRYKDFSSSLHPEIQQERSRNVMVLTGASGFLGAHILHLLLSKGPKVDAVYLLVRAKTPEDAYQRVSRVLTGYGLIDLHQTSHTKSRVVCLPCDLSDGAIGFSTQHLDDFSKASTTFIHTAWTVNFNLRLPSFEDQVSGTQQLIQFAIKSSAKFVFISSIAAVGCSASHLIREDVSEDPADASPMGYSESKWVAEQVCAAAYKAVTATESAPGSDMPPWMSIIRVGQLCGNQAGIWNKSEAYPLMLSTESLVGCLPRLEDQPLDWLPVDIAADAVLEIALGGQAKMPKYPAHQSSLATKPLVYHVLNPFRDPDWSQLLSWVSEDLGQGNLEVVPSSEWVTRLENTLAQTNKHHPSHVLVGLWKGSLVPEEVACPTGKIRPGSVQSYEMTRAKQSVPTLRNLEPLDKERVLKIWAWVRGNII
ncbi:unnamed protein product [Clonostachys chloroleuca]|uniref:Carrier domain-containing protein n=1 Tax=Clonostachys chloroleuca TaxID=1926264 RepID=A0AA35PXR6_9HYPO|nr:unnamed protein product [Clonostachys chloroleuca]